MAGSEGTGGADRLYRAHAEAALGEYLLELGRAGEAESHLRAAQRTLLELRGATYPDVVAVGRLLERL